MANNPYATRSTASIASGTSSSNVGEREDLANFISMITRDETPFISSIGKSKATATFHEWQTDTLAAPGNSKLIEGADFGTPDASGSNNDGASGVDAYKSGPNRTRLGNFTQINGKTIAVSGTKRAVDQAGVADEYAYQLKKRGTELRRDVEADIVNANQVASGSGARTMGGYTSWVNNDDTCVYKDDGTSTIDCASPAAASQGEGSTGITAGSADGYDAITLADIDTVMQGIYEEGGNATTLMTSPKIRRDISALAHASGVNTRRNIDDTGSLRQSIDVYMSDFGDLAIVPNYVMGLNVPTYTTATANTSFGNAFAFIYDPSYWALATLRPMSEVDVGQKGDSTVGMLVEEQTLECKNPKASGGIYGLK
jgi:hypothetical protein